MSKLVIIDDDPIDHFLMQHILQENSYFDKTTYTMDASLVLDFIEENRSDPDTLPDIIFLDLAMPQFDGWDFLDRFQNLIPMLDKNIKVYILTSSVRPTDRERSTHYPFIKSFISKPLEQSTINEIIQGATC
jgi:CheY-like chemotaxis protein